MSTPVLPHTPPLPNRGALIAVEGLDRAGKSTQCQLLLERLRANGHLCVLQRFPDRGTPIGKMIDAYLRGGGTASDIVTTGTGAGVDADADARTESTSVGVASPSPTTTTTATTTTTTTGDVEDHAIHLLFAANRWELSSKLLQYLNTGHTVILDRYLHSGIVFTAASKHIPVDWCRAPEIGLPQPDLVLFLNLPQEVAAARGGYGAERYEKREIQDRVGSMFARIRSEEMAVVNWKVVDAARAVDKVAQEVWDVVRPVVEQLDKGEIKRYMVDTIANS